MKNTDKILILLITTQDEYKAGHVDTCLCDYFDEKASVDMMVDVHVCLNKGGAHEYDNLKRYESRDSINKITITNLKLNKIDDLYARSPAEFNKIKSPGEYKLGGSTGPNNLFYESLSRLYKTKYKYILLLETDTQPIKKFWLDEISSFCDNNRFLIAGSTYKGESKLSKYEAWTGHLNGVAIYRNSPALEEFVTESKKLIEHDVKKNINRYISFDVAMHQLYCGKYGREKFQDQQQPELNLIDTPIITNMSLPSDKNISMKHVMSQHPHTIILHKKRS